MVKTKLQCAGASDPGRVRHNNEDAFHVDAERGIFLVVDGIGGQAAGEKAAEIAVDRLRARLERQTGTAEDRVREAITMANNEILRAARSNPEWQGMACVLTVVVLENGSAVAGHVGDTRLYQIRRGEIVKVTHDHSPVGEREDNHELDEAEAMRHPRRNEVYRDVGSEEHSPDDPDFIEVRRIPFDPAGALLLCTDGLSDQVPSREIRLAVERNAGDPERAVRELIEAANRAGGKDNVTVLVVEGEQFSAPGRKSKTAPGRKIFASRTALFFYGVLAALAAAWFTRTLWTPPRVVIAPRVLMVGGGAPFRTIEQAMATARAGDTVEVLPGEYREQVRLANGVALRSRMPREAVLRAAPMTGGPAVMAENVKGARVEGFRIQADRDAPLETGIVIVNSDVEVDDMEVEGAAVGVEIRGSSSPVLLGNAIHDCTAQGVLISGSSAPWLSHNSLERNKGAGLEVREEARPGLLGNVFEKNGLTLPPGISLETVKERNFLLDAGKAGHERPAQRGGRKQ